MLITCVKSNETTNTIEDLKLTGILQNDLSCYIAPSGFLVPKYPIEELERTETILRITYCGLYDPCTYDFNCGLNQECEFGSCECDDGYSDNGNNYCSVDDYSVSDKYGVNNLKSARKYVKTAKHLEKCKLDIQFLITCKTYDIVPKIPPIQAVQEMSPPHKTVQIEINFKNRPRRIENRLMKLFSSTGSPSFRTVNQQLKLFTQQTERTHSRKRHNLGIHKRIRPCNPDNIIFNYSNVQLAWIIAIAVVLPIGAIVLIVLCIVHCLRRRRRFPILLHSPAAAGTTTTVTSVSPVMNPNYNTTQQYAPLPQTYAPPPQKYAPPPAYQYASQPPQHGPPPQKYAPPPSYQYAPQPPQYGPPPPPQQNAHPPQNYDHTKCDKIRIYSRLLCIIAFYNLIIWISTLFAFTTTTKRHTCYVPFSASARFDDDVDLIHDVGHLHGGGRSSGLQDTGSITGAMPTSVASYPYWSGSGLVTAGVGACNHILHCRYARFMCSRSVDEQHTSWLKFSSYLELWYCSHRYSSKVEQSVFFNPDTRNPVDFDMFWSSSLNNVPLQEYVFKWMLQNVESNKEIFFGGVYGGECRKLLAGTETQIAELSRNQEEADDRIMFHINDGAVKHGVQSGLVDSRLTHLTQMSLSTSSSTSTNPGNYKSCT
ncbi:hypothetical protein GQR58_004754 [Nymphon striatum]|nr:hypothetical protein GQR58_004754 [Nymphon striatum]